MKNCLLILFYLVFTNERMFMIIAAFESFFSSFQVKSMAQGIELLTEKIQDIKINYDIFLERIYHLNRSF